MSADIRTVGRRSATPSVGEAREEADRYLERRLVLVLTADHGGRGRLHGDTSDPANFTVPFLVVGPGVPARADLYALDPTRRDPGTATAIVPAPGRSSA